MWQMLNHTPNDEVERRGFALPLIEADLSQSSTASLAHRSLYPRDRSNRLLAVASRFTNRCAQPAHQPIPTLLQSGGQKVDFCPVRIAHIEYNEPCARRKFKLIANISLDASTRQGVAVREIPLRHRALPKILAKGYCKLRRIAPARVLGNVKVPTEHANKQCRYDCQYHEDNFAHVR